MTINVISQLHTEATGLIDNFTISSVAATAGDVIELDLQYQNIAGALQMNYPAMAAGSSGGIYSSLHFDPQIGLNELFIKFDAKMPNIKHGCKFCKIFGYQNGAYVGNVAGVAV